jgi:hypothetical protein
MNIKGWSRINIPQFVFFVVAGVVAFSTNLTSVIVDNFHEGEYLGFVWHMHAYYKNLAEFPLLIHGAVDYLPSVIASFIYGEERIIVGTRQIGSIMLWLEWVMFLDLGYSLIPKSDQKKYWATVFVALFIALLPALGCIYLVMQGAIVGTRDFFLILSIWAFAKYLYGTSKCEINFFLLLTSFGVAASIFWCYDRGVMAVAFFCTIVLGCFFTKRKEAAWFLLISLLVSLFLIDYSNVVGSAVSNIENIKYWVIHGAELWSYPFEKQFLPYMGGAIMVLFGVAATSVAIFFRYDLTKNKGEGEGILILGIIAVLFLLLKTMMNRPGGSRTLMAIWPSILILIHYGPRMFIIPSLNLRKYFLSNSSISHIAFYTSVILLIFAAVNIQTLNHTYLRYGSYFKNLVSPHKDYKMVTAEMNHLANELKMDADNCYLGWSSEGVIAMMSKKRFCTKYTYAAYIAPGEEESFLVEIIRDPPKEIVFNSSQWSMTIEDVSIANRLPKVNQYIEQTYLTKRVNGTYTLVKR